MQSSSDGRIASRQGPAIRPGIDERNPAVLEVSAIGSRDGRVGGAGDGGDLTVGLQNRSAQGPVRGGNLPIGPCRGAVEGQYASGKVLADNGVDLRGKLVTAPALSRDGHPCCRQGSRSDNAREYWALGMTTAKPQTLPDAPAGALQFRVRRSRSSCHGPAR